MKKGTKIGLIVAGSVVAAAGIGVGIYFWVRPKNSYDYSQFRVIEPRSDGGDYSDKDGEIQLNGNVEKINLLSDNEKTGVTYENNSYTQKVDSDNETDPTEIEYTSNVDYSTRLAGTENNEEFYFSYEQNKNNEFTFELDFLLSEVFELKVHVNESLLIDFKGNEYIFFDYDVDFNTFDNIEDEEWSSTTIMFSGSIVSQEVFNKELEYIEDDLIDILEDVDYL